MSHQPAIKIIECSRDAMQGLHDFIPTATKVAYVQSLLAVGFDTLDVGSFVSPKAIPQMADTAEVLANLDLSATRTKLLAIVANKRGALAAAAQPTINYLGYPFSVSETFQIRNTNATIAESLVRLDEIQNIAVAAGRKLVVYLSMGFGNPYGDPWTVGIVAHWTNELASRGINIIQLSDTIGVSTPDSIEYLFADLIPAYPNIEIGAHLHTTPTTWREKLDAAYTNGCRRFDGALRGYGGCPMAADDLTGNMPTEHIIDFVAEHTGTPLNMDALNVSMQMLPKVFPHA